MKHVVLISNTVFYKDGERSQQPIKPPTFHKGIYNQPKSYKSSQLFSAFNRYVHRYVGKSVSQLKHLYSS